MGLDLQMISIRSLLSLSLIWIEASRHLSAREKGESPRGVVKQLPSMAAMRLPQDQAHYSHVCYRHMQQLIDKAGGLAADNCGDLLNSSPVGFVSGV